MEQIRLELVPSGIEQTAHASQFDRGRQIRFDLFNGGSAYTLSGAETITMVVNGQEEVVANTSDNYIVWDVAPEDCENEGVIECELRIVDGGVLIGSKNFFLEVEYDPYGAGVVILSVSGNPCTFETDLADNLVSLTADIVATGGGGTPATPIPIVGISSLEITANGDTYTIDLDGTRYGGVLDVKQGKLTITEGVYTFTGLETIYSLSLERFRIDINNYVNDIDNTIGASDLPNAKMEVLSLVAKNTLQNYENVFGLSNDGNPTVSLFMRLTSASTSTDVVNAITGTKIIYPLATPIEIDVSPISISTIVGTNNISSNGGGDVEVQFYKKA